MYRPVERGTATGWFLSGTLIGPALGPLIGGIIVTFRSWRVIFWLQSALAGTAFLGAFFLLPETIYHRRLDDLEGYSGWKKTRVLLGMCNPLRPVRLFRYPNLALTGFASSSLVWNMYTLLTPIRYVLNPRFNLNSPLLGGLFYLAPGLGYLVGTFGGGRYADWVVRRYIRKRGGVRVPEDRLYSALPFIGIAIPACVLVYGWGVDKAVGGIPLVVIMLFLQGIAQLFCFPSLNTYCLDVMPGRSAEVIAGNYGVRYLLACVGMSVVLPGIDAMGVGWFSTISVVIVLLGALSTLLVILYGRKWREAIDERRREKRRRELARKSEKDAEKGETVKEKKGGKQSEKKEEEGQKKEEV
jgi:MFS family permease